MGRGPTGIIFFSAIWRVLVTAMAAQNLSADQLLANEARGNGIMHQPASASASMQPTWPITGTEQPVPVQPVWPSVGTSQPASARAAAHGVADWLSSAATAINDAITTAASQPSRKSKMAKPDAADSARGNKDSRRDRASPNRNEETVDATYVQDIVTGGLTAALKVMGEASDKRFKVLEEDVSHLHSGLSNVSAAAQQQSHDILGQSLELADLRNKVQDMEKNEEARKAEAEKLRAEQQQALQEMKQIAEQAKASAPLPPPGLQTPSRVSHAASSATTNAPSIPHEMRTEAILSGLGQGLTPDELLARAAEVLGRAGVDNTTHEPPTANFRATAVFIIFREAGQLRIASDKIRRINASYSDKRVWLDARRTRSENRPNRAIHRAVEALTELIDSVRRDGNTCPLAAEDLTKNMRKLTVEQKASGPVVCWWNVRLQELTFSEATQRCFAELGRAEDLAQISAWCSLE